MVLDRICYKDTLRFRAFQSYRAAVSSTPMNTSYSIRFYVKIIADSILAVSLVFYSIVKHHAGTVAEGEATRR